MNTKNKLNRLSFLKNKMMNSGANETEDIEPTICQIFRDIFGIGSDYTKKADKMFYCSVLCKDDAWTGYKGAV